MSPRSDGTFGLSRNKCTSSNVISITRLTPWPSRHASRAAEALAQVVAEPRHATCATQLGKYVYSLSMTAIAVKGEIQVRRALGP